MKQLSAFFNRGDKTAEPTPESVKTQARAGLEQLDVATSQWSPTTRYVGIAILVVIILVALRLAAPIIPLAFLTFVFSFLFFRPVGWLSKRVNQSWVRSLALFYAIVAVATILGILLIPKMIDQLNDVIAQMGTNTDQFQAQMQTSDPSQATVTINGNTYNLGPIAQTVKDFANGDSQSSTRPYIQNINLDTTRAAASAFGTAVGQWLGQFLTELVTYTGIILFSLLITFFTLSDWPHQRGVLNKWLPATFERDVLLILKQIEGAWFGFFKGDMIMGAIMTVISWVEYWLLGVPAPWALGVLNGFIGIIPGIGGILSSVIVAIPCLIVGSTRFPSMNHGAFALLVLLINAIITSIAYTIFAPYVIGDATDVPKPLVMVGSFIGLAAAGIIGAFLAVPIISTGIIVTRYLADKVYGKEPFPGEPMPTSAEGFLSQLYQPPVSMSTPPFVEAPADSGAKIAEPSL